MFKPYLQDSKYFKIWHNYSFDRHIFGNHAIDVQGFGGDTMHLARLYDPSRKPNEYSLAFLTKYHSTLMQRVKEQTIRSLRARELTIQESDAVTLFENHFLKESTKESMTKIFGVKREGSKVLTIPTVIQMHCNAEYAERWVNYSTLDTEATYFLYYTFINLLRDIPTDLINPGKPNEYKMRNLLDIYQMYWLPFGEILTNMEREGFTVDSVHANSIKEKAINDMKKYEIEFKQWVQTTQQTSTEHFNPSSIIQLQQLIYAPWKRNEKTAPVQRFAQPQRSVVEEGSDEQKETNDTNQPDQQVEEAREYSSDGRVLPLKRKTIEFPEVREFLIENPDYEKGNPLKPRQIKMQIKGLGLEAMSELMTDGKVPSCDVNALKKMVGQLRPDGSYSGSLYAHLTKTHNTEYAATACKAFESLLQLRAIEVLYGTFIEPLCNPESTDGKVHCSLNINTETGRLSSRNPNMQNQPALEKDRYQIRRCFVASPGNKLVVADYGQLELRVLAHMTNCKAMIEAFNLGGDFHSRTAMVSPFLKNKSMYPEIKKQIDAKELLLEWDKSKGLAPAPLLKDKYANERKKAKTMNFSIAYGKTQTGFAQEWGVTNQEAQKVIDLWYHDRPEVKEWQQATKVISQKRAYTQTLLGRYRVTEKYFAHCFGPDRMLRHDKRDYYYWHGLRASINTPIQGGAADIVIAAMVKVDNNQRLKQLGWKLLLQVHDELILEGPVDSANEALQLIKHDMEHPFDTELRLPLEVDAKIGRNWYECK